jgi:lysophospholipase L1-like esterase
MTGFPTTLTNPSTTLKDRIIKEGEAWSTSAFVSTYTWNGTTTGSGQTVSSLTATTATKAILVTGITISTSRPMVIQLNRGINNGILIATRHYVNGSITINSDYLIMPWDNVSISCVYAPDTTASQLVTASLEGYRFFPDLHFNAEKTVYYIGDSKLNGSGVTLSENSVLSQFRNYLINSGKDIRILGKSISGSTSSDHEINRKRGLYNLDVTPSLIIIDLGTNDAIGAVSSSLYTTNVINLISQFRSQPNTANSIILVTSILPLSNTTNEASAVSLRAALQTALAARTSDTKTFFVSTTANLWNAVSGAAANQTDGIHPNDTGNTLWATAYSNFLTANNINI